MKKIVSFAAALLNIGAVTVILGLFYNAIS